MNNVNNMNNDINNMNNINNDINDNYNIDNINNNDNNTDNINNSYGRIFIKGTRKRLKYLKGMNEIEKNEEKLFNSNTWVPSNVEDINKLNIHKQFFNYDKTKYNLHRSVCTTCFYGSTWKIGFENYDDMNKTRCSNPNCNSNSYFPIVIE